MFLYTNVYDGDPLVKPRAVAVGAAGDLEGVRAIADTGNDRVVLLGRDGAFLRSFGSTCRLGEGEASGCVDPDGSGPLQLGDGQFNEPWGIAVGQTADGAGRIFVSDTWNGRIQVFDAEGNFLAKWGLFAILAADQTDPMLPLRPPWPGRGRRRQRPGGGHGQQAHRPLHIRRPIRRPDRRRRRDPGPL